LKIHSKAAFSGLATITLIAGGCAKPPKPIVVGSENSTEQIVVGEIVAQHLEHALHRKVARRLGLGDESILYQAIVGGDVTLYPDYPAAIEAVILREHPDPNPDIVLDRARSELLRTAQLKLLDPLGYESTPVVAVKSADAHRAKVKTLSDAETAEFRWKLGVSYNFEQRAGGATALSAYAIPMEQGTRAMEPSQLFPALERGEVTMVASTAADGRLLSSEYTVLTDDRGVFPAYRACLLVRRGADPALGPALASLSGKLSTETVRKLTAAVDLDHRNPAEVAARFLAEAGL
jgi:glycine betaine/choline ABC-type transport system substrate-binding protein